MPYLMLEKQLKVSWFCHCAPNVHVKLFGIAPKCRTYAQYYAQRCAFRLLSCAKTPGKCIRVDKLERWHTPTPASGTTGNSGTPGLHIVENAMIQQLDKPDINLNRKSRSKRKEANVIIAADK